MFPVLKKLVHMYEMWQMNRLWLNTDLFAMDKKTKTIFIACSNQLKPISKLICTVKAHKNPENTSKKNFLSFDSHT